MAIPTAPSLPPAEQDLRLLDRLLGAFPQGALSEIVGPHSSGGTSLLLALIARATAAGGQVALVDGPDAFDPAAAAGAGADLSRVLWVRCGGRLGTAVSAADLLARCPGLALVTLDLLGLGPGRRPPLPPAACLRLQRAVEGTPTALVLRVPRHLAGSAAALVLSLSRREARWVGWPRPTRLGGLGSEARVLRSRPRSPLREGEEVAVRWRL